MRDDGVIYVASHPLLIWLPGCIDTPWQIFLRNDLYYVGWGIPAGAGGTRPPNNVGWGTVMHHAGWPQVLESHRTIFAFFQELESPW